LPEEDWSRWFRRRSWWPFTRRWMFEDIDEMFSEINEIMEREFRELSKKAPRDLIRERTLPNGTKVKSWGPFMYGYSVTVGPDGKPQVREFGNIKPGTRLGRPHINIREKREPLADVMTTNGEVNVTVELPGVEKNDIKLHGTENSLTISVDTPQYKYHKEVELHAKVDPRQAKSTYKNGVLQVTLKKRKEEEPKDQPVEIE
jgi:HSP20 family protein